MKRLNVLLVGKPGMRVEGTSHYQHLTPEQARQNVDVDERGITSSSREAMSYGVKQGIFSAEQGIVSTEQGRRANKQRIAAASMTCRKIPRPCSGSILHLRS
jgi:hypothetical protein